MKRIMLITIILAAIFLIVADDQIPPVNLHKQSLALQPETIVLPSQNRAVYNFMFPPISLLDSYWDYQIGGYTSLPVRVQSTEAGGGVYLAFMGQRTSNGQRRVFFSYINNDGSVETTNELTPTQRREGYVSVDVDRISGKPIFAWHTDADPSDGELEVNYAWDAYLEHIPGLIGGNITAVDNPVSLTINNVAYNDNEFIWPLVEIGPSPVQDHRRAYVFSTNGVSHSAPANASENVYIAYADFTPEMLELGTELTWSYTTVPLLDQWNTDQTAWRRYFHATVLGEDGKVYMIGYHVGSVGEISISEPYLDVLVNSNYGEGDWARYTINPDITVPNPLNYFVDDSQAPYPFLRYAVTESTNDNGFISNDGHLHYPILYGFTTPDSTGYWPLLQYVKDLDFDVNEHTFLLHDLYPTGVNPNDGNPILPWDMNEDGIVDTVDATTPSLFASWPFVHWDTASDGGNMIFDYNTIKFSKMNDHGMVACVWSSSLNAKLYNESPANYPELAPYTNVPEIFISVYPINGSNGPQWSEPIMLNSIDTPDLNPGGNPMIPEWVYPGDYIEYLGVDIDGNKVGKLHLMFMDDNTWGAQALAGQSDGGRIMYAAMEISWKAGEAYEGPIVGTDDPTVSPYQMKLSNYPNPFNPSTTIAYNVAKPGLTTITIYNVKGQKVKSLVNENKLIGQYTATWNGTSDNGSKVGSGVYFYRLENGGKTITNKMVLMK